MNDESTELSSTSFESFAGAVRSRLSQRQQIHKSDLKSKRFRRSLRSSAINEVSSANTTYASFDIDGAILRAQKTANLIYQRFEFWHPKRYLFFLYSMNLPTWTWDILKYKLALKVLLPIGAQAKAGGAGSNANSRPSTAASSLSSNENKEFLYVFGGSSVTAGHDNWFNESYPMVFQRRLQPIYDALGVPLKVHNIAQGANNCFPADYCYGAMGGAAADWINWEQVRPRRLLLNHLLNIASYTSALHYEYELRALIPHLSPSSWPSSRSTAARQPTCMSSWRAKQAGLMLYSTSALVEDIVQRSARSCLQTRLRNGCGQQSRGRPRQQVCLRDVPSLTRTTLQKTTTGHTSTTSTPPMLPLSGISSGCCMKGTWRPTLWAGSRV